MNNIDRLAQHRGIVRLLLDGGVTYLAHPFKVTVFEGEDRVRVSRVQGGKWVVEDYFPEDVELFVSDVFDDAAYFEEMGY